MTFTKEVTIFEAYNAIKDNFDTINRNIEEVGSYIFEGVKDGNPKKNRVMKRRDEDNNNIIIISFDFL